MAELLKLNLGCGKNPLSGYINVDKFGTPDVQHDLESLPWPWPNSSAAEVVLHHVLEHLGETSEKFLGIIQEIYRVCAPGALVRIVVPHPRHDDFLNDPTHVRVVTPDLLQLFSKTENQEWIKKGNPNTPLALYLGVDFKLMELTHVLDEPWASQFTNGQVSADDIRLAVRKFNNVVKEMKMVFRIIKNQE
jgi:hypothetical protein